MKPGFAILLTALFAGAAPAGTSFSQPVRLAVEFMDHAAAAQIAREKGWFREAGLEISAFDSYLTGMALASALARGEVDAAYLCLVPALNARINAGVDLRILCGTHLYGYGLVVDPLRVSGPDDLLNEDVRLGCVRQGGAADVLMNRYADTHGIARQALADRARRMSPPRLVLALKAGKLDAAFLPEHYASVAESLGFRLLDEARDCWPGMVGSVLVARRDFLENRPRQAAALISVTRRSTEWLLAHPQEAAQIVAGILGGDGTGPGEAGGDLDLIPITPATIERSMARLEFATDLDPVQVEFTMDYLEKLGYIRRKIPLEETIANFENQDE